MAINETDPTGRAPSDPGAKLDAGKPRVALMMKGFARALLEVAKVSTFGANKYSPGGWATVPDGQERYDDAMMRHKLADWIGEERDPDSQLLHQAQEAWNALAKLELMLRQREDDVMLNNMRIAAMDIHKEMAGFL